MVFATPNIDIVALTFYPMTIFRGNNICRNEDCPIAK
jgi:hypothetical protein